MDPGVRKEVAVGEEESGGESVVLQGGEVEDGEEVVRGGGQVQAYPFKAARRVSDGEEEEEEEEEEEQVPEEWGDLVSESDGVSGGGRFGLGSESGYCSGQERRRRRCSSGSQSFNEALVVGRASMKRKYVANECGLGSENVLYEDTDSDDSASSSDSDASGSEYECLSSKERVRNKRRRNGDEIYGTISTTDELRSHHESAICNDELKEMQHLLELQLQASERREAGMKQQMEAMMEMLSKHMGHVEKRVCNLEVGAEPQDQILQQINVKLEKVMEGFTALNENLSLLSACLSQGLESQ